MSTTKKLNAKSVSTISSLLLTLSETTFDLDNHLQRAVAKGSTDLELLKVFGEYARVTVMNRYMERHPQETISIDIDGRRRSPRPWHEARIYVDNLLEAISQ